MVSRPRTTLREGIRALPGPVWIISAGSFVNRFGSFVAVFLVLYLRDQGYSIAESGLVVGFYGDPRLTATWLATCPLMALSTASSVFIPRSTSSFTRVRMKTW